MPLACGTPFALPRAIIEMSAMLRSGLHHCHFNGAVVLFDLFADRYFLLTDQSVERFDLVLAGHGTSADEDHLRSLGLLADDTDRNPRLAIPPPVAARSLVDEPSAKASMAATISCIWEQRRARRDLQNNSLSDIVTGLGRRSDRLAPSGADDCRDITAAFVRAKRYMSSDDRCLVRGIAMTRMLARRGVAASLVFGVTMPFAAHSWVQVGDTVLTDSLDVVLHYRPIFAV
ncbi:MULTISPECIES: lasso peptide biosynthesis B2 protein [unclassified Sphingopyxis]|uniref:lasso peptide biosynthesis B2 protein n=3 Tax=Sphingopyxis TaxID=165697 RepID=UPI000A56FF2C|nr:MULTISPECIES: lasso peptide biosynthesis B2 protein [unclassified Sphingopyxis]